MKKSLMTILVSMLAMSLATGCDLNFESDKKDDPIIPQKPAFPSWNDERETVSGPDLSGIWMSTCTEQAVNVEEDKLFRQFIFTFKGLEITRSEKLYTDRNCATLKKDDTASGQYRYVQAYSGGSYEVEYALKKSSGNVEIEYYPLSKFWLRSGILYISDMKAGDLSTFEEDEPLFKDGIDPRGHMIVTGNYETPSGGMFEIRMDLADGGEKILGISKNGQPLSVLICERNSCEGRNSSGEDVSAKLKSSSQMTYTDPQQGENLLLTLKETE